MRKPTDSAADRQGTSNASKPGVHLSAGLESGPANIFLSRIRVDTASQSIVIPASLATCFAVPILHYKLLPISTASGESNEQCRKRR